MAHFITRYHHGRSAMIRSVVLASLLCAYSVAPASAQYAPAPTQYTIVTVTGGQTQHIYRDGDKVLLDLQIPKSTARHAAIHLRTIVDAPTTTQLSWDLIDPSVPCNSVAKGDWGNPFDFWRQMALDDSIAPTEVGKDSVNGMATTTYEKTTPDVRVELWREDRYGLLVKAVMIPKGRAPVEVFEIKAFTVGAPDPSVFAVPARCGWGK